MHLSGPELQLRAVEGDDPPETPLDAPESGQNPGHGSPAPSLTVSP